MVLKISKCENHNTNIPILIKQYYAKIIILLLPLIYRSYCGGTTEAIEMAFSVRDIAVE